MLSSEHLALTGHITREYVASVREVLTVTALRAGCGCEHVRTAWQNFVCLRIWQVAIIPRGSHFHRDLLLLPSQYRHQSIGAQVQALQPHG